MGEKGRPHAAIHAHTYVVATNEHLTDDLWRIVIEAPELAATIAPGQFVELTVPGDATRLVPTPVSFSAADADAGTIEIVYAVVGPDTERLSRMQPGASAQVVGPCGGRGWWVPKGCERALVVAGGVGAPPVVAAAGMLRAAGVEVDAVLGSQRSSRLWGEDRLRAMGVGEVVITTDDGSAGICGNAADGMRELLARGGYDVVMTCGPQVMMAAVARLAAEHDMLCEASLERMMTCGIGACNTCNVDLVGGGVAGACTDGPVFDAREVVW